MKKMNKMKKKKNKNKKYKKKKIYIYADKKLRKFSSCITLK
jgi:hypothetical protein